MMEGIIGIIAFSIIVSIILFMLLLKINHKVNADFNKNTKDEFAERKKVSHQFTPIRGGWALRVSEKQWIDVMWDKRKGCEFLEIILPPNTHQNRAKYPIYINRKNWHVVKDLPPKTVTVDEYFKRQVM